MEFMTFPPEVTSALIHSGPGAESLIEASAAWQQLGTNLEESAGVTAVALSSLVGSWQGPSAIAMAQAVEPYLTWLRTMAQQAQQSASSARAAVAAFSAVSAAVVPVSQVTANRTRLARLLATNILGVNLPAIALTEDQYQAMWANNSAAMSRYQAASAQATTTLPQFSSPRSITNPTGLAAQAKATPTTAAGDPINLGFGDPTSGYFGLANQWGNQFISSGFPFNMLSYVAQTASAQALQTVGGDIGQGLSEGQSALGPRRGIGSVGCVRRRRTLGRTHGSGWCWSDGGQVDRSARRGGAVARIASAGPARVGGNAASRGRPRLPDAAAADAAADLGGQWLAQTQAAKVRRYRNRQGAQGDGDAPAAIGGMSDPPRQLTSGRWGAAGVVDNRDRSGFPY
jgi:PPE-repeat protein